MSPPFAARQTCLQMYEFVFEPIKKGYITIYAQFYLVPVIFLIKKNSYYI